MTNDEARAKAVEAAALWVAYEQSWSDTDARYFAEGVLRAYERTMAEAGWVMVRDVGEMPDPPEHDGTYFAGVRAGHNACRAAMLGRDGEEG